MPRPNTLSAPARVRELASILEVSLRPEHAFESAKPFNKAGRKCLAMLAGRSEPTRG